MLICYTLDIDVNREIGFKHPEVYRAGHVDAFMNHSVFFTWVGFALIHGCLIFWLPVLVYYLSKN